MASDLHSAIIGQESGWNPNVGVSPKGAHGLGQITPGTFKQFARPGESLDNAEDNLAVSKRIVQSYLGRWGDPARAAVAYFSGPGNVSEPGSLTPWKEDRSDGRVRTSQYVSEVLGRMGKEVPAEWLTVERQGAKPQPQPKLAAAPEPTGEAEQLAQAQMLAVLSSLLPKYKFTPVDYDPFAVIEQKELV